MFGGIDAEFRWVARRLHDGTTRFSLAAYDDNARSSVAQYGRFLAALTTVVDPALLRICSTFPSVLRDATWVEIYVAVHRSDPEKDRRLAEALRAMEIPDLSTRTRLRALYNEHLRALCRVRGLLFVDAFTPFLDAEGNPDMRCFPADVTDHHLDYLGTGATLVEIVRSAVHPAMPVMPALQAPPQPARRAARRYRSRVKTVVG